MYGVIDRFEGEFAVIEKDDKKVMNIKRILLPENAGEGDVIDLESMTVDEKETLRRKENIQKLAEKMFRDE
ncbi:MAG: DUF3006 domain-containing protein [Tepidanaerobacteraceae bacterium]|jgi:hypothetical protein|nr:DUF3006 domain-containing protein [Tepidanaerobacteraceae bacterium]